MTNNTAVDEWPDEIQPLIRLGRRVQEEIGEFIHLEMSGSMFLLIASVIAGVGGYRFLNLTNK
jgi:hypothetical protein